MWFPDWRVRAPPVLDPEPEPEPEPEPAPEPAPVPVAPPPTLAPTPAPMPEPISTPLPPSAATLGFTPPWLNLRPASNQPSIEPEHAKKPRTESPEPQTNMPDLVTTELQELDRLISSATVDTSGALCAAPPEPEPQIQSSLPGAPGNEHAGLFRELGGVEGWNKTFVEKTQTPPDSWTKP